MKRSALRVLVLSALAAHLNGCRGGSSGPDGLTANVAGVWDAQFTGTVRGLGTSQTDSFLLELTQSGPSVTGTMCAGRCPPGDGPLLQVSGAVNGAKFVYSARASLAPGCEVTVEAEVTVNAPGTEFTGPQTQSTCEGTADGSITARKM